MIGIDLYWRRGDDDELALGKAFLDALPPIGTLLAYPTVTPNVVWRIDTLYVHPAQFGFMTEMLAALGGRQEQVAIYAAFVSPAEGPHATAPEDR